MTTLSIHNVTAIEKIEQTHYVGGHEFRSTKISIADSKGNLHESHPLQRRRGRAFGCARRRRQGEIELMTTVHFFKGWRDARTDSVREVHRHAAGARSRVQDMITAPVPSRPSPARIR